MLFAVMSFKLSPVKERKKKRKKKKEKVERNVALNPGLSGVH